MPDQMHQIDRLAEVYGLKRSDLEEAVQALEGDIATAKRKHRRRLKKALSEARQARLDLRQSIQDNPELFDKPRSRILHGIKVGFRKQPGQINWSNPKQVIKLIRKLFPEQADLLIRSSESPHKPALKTLPAKDLARLGVTTTDSFDEVVTEATDSDIDRLIGAYFDADELAELESE